MQELQAVFPHQVERKKMEEERIHNLVQQAKAGSEQAFTELWTEYEGQVRSLVGAWLGYNYPDAVPDVVQEISLKAFKFIWQFNGDSKFFTWLYRLAKNACIDFSRKSRRYANQVPIEEATELPDKPPSTATVDAQLAIAEQTLLEMGEQQQKILRMVIWEGEPCAEVAKSLGIPRQKVYDTLKGFRQRLRRRPNDLAS